MREWEARQCGGVMPLDDDEMMKDVAVNDQER